LICFFIFNIVCTKFVKFEKLLVYFGKIWYNSSMIDNKEFKEKIASSKDLKKYPCIIFSKSMEIAYNLRLKLNSLGFESEYKNRIVDLFDFILDNKEGLVIIYTKSQILQNYIERFALSQAGRDLAFVFVKNDFKLKVIGDDLFSFVVDYNNFLDVIPKVISKSSDRLFTKNISPEVINFQIDLILKNFEISKKYLGYRYIKDCVKIMYGNKSNEYTSLKDIYMSLATKYQKEPSSIEKTIRDCIKKAYKKSKEKFNNVFINHRISNLTFINYILENLEQTNLKTAAN